MNFDVLDPFCVRMCSLHRFRMDLKEEGPYTIHCSDLCTSVAVPICNQLREAETFLRS